MENQNNNPTRSRKSRGRPRGQIENSGANTIKALERAMMVFEHLSIIQGATLSQLAQELKQSHATVYRILVTLEARKLVEFDDDLQLWYVGPTAFRVGAQFLHRTNLVDRARPILRYLMEQTGETANLGVEQNHHVLFVSQAETRANIRAFFPPGSMSKQHASGIGKAILAYSGAGAIDGFLTKAPFEQFTNMTLTTADDLATNLSQTKARGYAVDDEERDIGMRCIAAPVFNASGQVIAGISVSGPTSRVGRADIKRLGNAVMSAAADLSASIGHVPIEQG